MALHIMIGIVARRTTTSQHPQYLCLHLTTAASSYSRHRHRHGSVRSHRHHYSAYNYVAAATVSLPTSSLRLPRATVAIAIGLALHIVIGIVARRTTTSQQPQCLCLHLTMAASSYSRHRHRQGSVRSHRHHYSAYNYVAAATVSLPTSSLRLPRATVAIAIGLALHIVIGIVARRTTTSQHPQCLCLHLTVAASSYSRQGHRHGSSYHDRHRCSAYNYLAASTVSLPASDYGCLELQSSSPSTWIRTQPSASLLGVQLCRSSHSVSTHIFATAASSYSRHRHRPGSSYRDRHRCSAYNYVTAATVSLPASDYGCLELQSSSPSTRIRTQPSASLLGVQLCRSSHSVSTHIFATAASSYSRHRHRPGSSYRDRHRCSAYNYVAAATVSLPASDYGCLELQSPSPSAWLFIS